MIDGCQIFLAQVEFAEFNRAKRSKRFFFILFLFSFFLCVKDNNQSSESKTKLYLCPINTPQDDRVFLFLESNGNNFPALS